MVLIIWAN